VCTGGVRQRAASYGINRQGAKVEPAVIDIIVHPVADKPGKFEARLASGDLLLGASRPPFCDASRRLLHLGANGAAVLTMRHQDATAECLRAPISTANRRRVGAWAGVPPSQDWSAECGGSA
jgi:hypothetical protein